MNYDIILSAKLHIVCACRSVTAEPKEKTKTEHSATDNHMELTTAHTSKMSPAHTTLVPTTTRLVPEGLAVIPDYSDSAIKSSVTTSYANVAK